MTIKLILSKEHQEEILTNDLAIICFSATWCIVCNKIKPYFYEIAYKYPHLNFYMVDIDINEEFVKKIDISAIPTFIILKNGKKITNFINIDIKSFEDYIKKL